LRPPASTTVTVRADTAEEPGDELERALGRAQADPLRRTASLAGADEPVEALEAEREVSTALGPGDRVDLVDDHVLDAAQDLARLARQHQVQRFGRGDQDVGRPPREVATILGGRVAGPARDGDVRGRHPEPCCSEGNPGERRAQVALDVVGERLERADVQDPDRARFGLRRRSPRWGRGETIEGPEEGRQRLAAAGRGVDQRVVAVGDRSPALGLGLGRSGERALEPRSDGGREGRERVAAGRAGCLVATRDRHGGHGSRQYRRP
jgi:hypothetical protein